MKKISKLVVGWLALTFAATVVWAGSEKLSSDLNGRSNNVEVIVQYKVTPTEAHHQKVAALGGTLHSKMDFIKGAHYTVPASALQTLANDPDVAYITPDRAIQPSFDQITDGTVYSNVVNSAGYNGAGVGVAIIDSGIVDLIERRLNRAVGGYVSHIRIVGQRL